MYTYIKRFVQKIFPSDFWLRHESKLRSFIYFFYFGFKYECNICDKTLRRFIHLPGGQKLCPYCGSSSRNRRLWNILEPSYLKDETCILHFSPSRSLYRKFKANGSVDYASSDFAGEFLADKQLDITQISEADNSYDLIICYHILEHIVEDQAAMSELLRILKPGGCCFIQTPIKDGDIYEDNSITDSDQRKIHFGQADHVRIYSLNGLMQRLRKVGFDASASEYLAEADNRFGVRQVETVIFARKLQKVDNE